MSREIWVAEMSQPGEDRWTPDEGNADKGTIEDYAREQNEMLKHTGNGMKYRVVRYVPEPKSKTAPPNGA